MLRLKNICKYYQIGKEKKTILNNITLDFKKGELVLILGASGSGKSTLLNIIAGNLKADSGEIWLDNICVSKFNNKKLDNYRSCVIGNVFQDYNLIDYMSVYDNILLGSNNLLDKNKIITLMKQVSIYDKRKMLVNKLSGGEKQRVAIVRALVNNPDIILADEPTGALDSKNSIEIMEILKRIANDKLVIVVSHDINLANKYATRIINIKDGMCEYLPVISDTQVMNNNFMNKNKYFKILKMAVKNLWIKKTRTLLTSLALSLGIICMALVVNLYSNFNNEINNLEKRIVSVFPIVISNGEFEILDANYEKTDDKIIIKNKDKYIHTNRINEKYLNYLNNISEIKYITYNYDISMPIISDRYKIIDNKYFVQLPNDKYINSNYEILYGRNIANKNEILLKVDKNNNVDSELLNSFNINTNINYNEIINRKVKIILNDLYYIKNGNYYVINDNISKMYNNSDIELTVVGIIREREETENNNCFYYDKNMLDIILDKNSKSDIVNMQIKNNYNVLGLNIEKNEMLAFLGYNSLPSDINIYVDNIDDKKAVLQKLDDYNKDNNKLIYTDTMAASIDIVRKFILIISTILIFFAVISIIISSLMIGILTNVRVLERKKEIGILRSLGYSRSDLRRLFDTENIIIGIISSIISLACILILVKPINKIIYSYLEISDMLSIKYYLMFIVFISIILIVKIFGSIPARKASKMNIVDCIYGR